MSGPEEADATEARKRRERGHRWYEFVNGHPASDRDTPFHREGAVDFVFGEVWSRPGLDTRSRRWISLTSAVAAGAMTPLQAHMHSAMKSGDITVEEMKEFALHVAVYQGWPKGALVDLAIREAWAKIEDEGGIEKSKPPE